MSENHPETAVVFGVGPGLGAALARRLAREGMAVAVLAREFGPEGIHVAHVIIDGQIAAEHRGERHRSPELCPRP